MKDQYRVVQPDGQTFAWAVSLRMARRAVEAAKYEDGITCSIEMIPGTDDNEQDGE